MQHIISHFGYFGVFFIVFTEAIGIPFPAETTLTVSGIEWTHGVFKLVPLWLAGAFGNIVGSTIAYAIGRYLGRPVILYFGRYVGITPTRLEKANDNFEKYQLWVVIFAKFIAGIRILVPYLAGINQMNFWLFMPFNALSAIVWSGAFIIAGHYIGEILSLIWPYLHHHLALSILILCVLIALFVLVKVHEHRRKRGEEMERQVNTETKEEDELEI